MSTDRELLAAAANANGAPWRWVKCPRYGDTEVPGVNLYDTANDVDYWPAWNPLADSGQALDLAVKLGLCVASVPDSPVAYSTAYACGQERRCNERHESDPCAATRRAIVRAAAESYRATPPASPR